MPHILAAYPKANVRLVGYADARGSDATNTKLGSARAAAVAKALTDGGIAINRITTGSGGDSNPVATNATAGGQFANAELARMCNRYIPGEHHAITALFAPRRPRQFNAGPDTVNPKDSGWVVRAHDGEMVLDQMLWALPLVMSGSNGTDWQVCEGGASQPPCLCFGSNATGAILLTKPI